MAVSWAFCRPTLSSPPKEIVLYNEDELHPSLNHAVVTQGTVLSCDNSVWCAILDDDRPSELRERAAVCCLQY